MSNEHQNVPPTVPDRSPLTPHHSLPARSGVRINRRRVPPLRCAPRRLRERRGVLLLVVLSMLVLFVLLTVTYVIVATKERVTSKAAARVEISGDPPSQICDSLLMTLLRDTTNIHSPFHTWSLLEGIYGNVSFHGNVGKASQVLNGTGGTVDTGGQFYNIALYNGPSTYQSAADYYKGCVLTMINGPCAGVSTRIVGSNGTGLTVMRFRHDAGLVDPKPGTDKPTDPGDAFIVNGPAYSGMGRGYDPNYTPGQMAPASQAPCGYYYVDPTDPTNSAKWWEYALLPNPAYFQPRAKTTLNPVYNDPAGWAGANVDYTAYDYNNMYLGLLTNDTSSPPKLPPVLPSFHRSELYAYWNERLKATTGITRDLERKISFRPTKPDHPIFCAATNQPFTTARPDPINPMQMIPGPAWPDAPLDVDNMGTGTPDSIWIDPGLPVMTARDGRTYKVMVAPLILDMDGRVNVNAHGSYTQVDQTSGTSPYPVKGVASISSGGIAGGGKADLPIGEGYGPAEINLLQLFPPAVAQAAVQNLIYGGNASSNPSGYQGRHGGVGTGYYSSTASQALAALKMFEGPANDARDVNALTAYGTPPDLKGRRYLALDYRGVPLFLTTPSASYPASDSFAKNANTYWTNEVFGDGSSIPDSPYGFNLFAPKPGRDMPSGSSLDNPFTVAELERIMRPYDIDTRALAPRLAGILQQALKSEPSLAGKVTTESWDVPVPSLAVPRELRTIFASAGKTRAFQITDLVRAKLKSNPNFTTPTSLDAEIAKILPPELIAGLRMDINRPFGNGRDDDGNRSVDDVVEADTEAIKKATMPVWPTAYTNQGIASIPLSLTNGNGAATNDPLLKNTAIYTAWKPRQLMARYLYTLMMLLTDQGYVSWINPNEKNLALGGAQKLTSRRVAQWAINAACFRDSTSAMTPFVYHSQMFQSNKYKGWLVNGDPNPNADPGQTEIPDRDVVWGCKPPDLVLTETIAFHDRRTADTTTDDGPKTRTDDQPPKEKDANFDQIRIPQGSLFVELYCCRNASNPIAPGDLYFYNTFNRRWELDLGKMTRDKDNNPVPVWRMVITETPRGGKASADIGAQMKDHPETFSPHSGSDDTGSNPFTMHLNSLSEGITARAERVVWLGERPPKGVPTSGKDVFYNRTGATHIAPSQYAVIGPRDTTYIGSTGSSPYGNPSSQSIAIRPGVTTAGTANDPTASELKQPARLAPVGMIVAADMPTVGTPWTNAAHKSAGIGLNVSEPLPQSGIYYPEPTVLNPATGLVEGYGGTPVNTAPKGIKADSAAPFPNVPLEGTKVDLIKYPPPDTNAQNRPLVKDGVKDTGTYERYKYVFLQRLADPLLPFDALENPYMTVDWMPIDLTTFNGEQPSSPDPDDQGTDVSKVVIAGRQRGGSDPKNNLAQPTFNIWAPLTSDDSLPKDIVGGQVPGANFPNRMRHTLGYLNQAFGPGFDTTTQPVTSPPGQYIGDPQKPFPWITWNARPYANLMELLLVPASSPDRLLFEFNSPGTTPGGPPAPGTVNPYDPAAQANFRYPFGHLLNFLSSTDKDGTPAKSANFYRVLEYLQVPSRFVGTETMLNPKFFKASNANLAPFLPPFNSVSNYRDPGLVNINTMTAQEVWNAIVNGGPGPTFNDFVDSRRGDGAPPSGSLITSDAKLPTSFAGVFRSAASADLVPLPAPATMTRPAVNATLLRPDKTGQVPLFGSIDPKNFNDTAAQKPYNDSSRNPYFAYQGLERISNNVTTRSNVFAVWLTIGYFEVLPWPQQGVNYGPGMPVTTLGGFSPADYAAHADGYQLGAELGSDTGEIVRHRAFYIIDRSIPVGYERGQNHNVNRAILLRRFIE
jgi:hypothetical protein